MDGGRRITEKRQCNGQAYQRQHPQLRRTAHGQFSARVQGLHGLQCAQRGRKRHGLRRQHQLHQQGTEQHLSRETGLLLQAAPYGRLPQGEQALADMGRTHRLQHVQRDTEPANIPPVQVQERLPLGRVQRTPPPLRITRTAHRRRYVRCKGHGTLRTGTVLRFHSPWHKRHHPPPKGTQQIPEHH